MSIFDRIEAIPWFVSVGVPLREIDCPVVLASSWPEAIKSCSDIEWENFNLERRNELTLYLNHVCKGEFRKWNTVANEIRERLQQGAWLAMRKRVADLAIPQVIAECTEWDTGNAVMTDRYRAHSPPSFFLQLLEIYEQGHFPCGWKGKWPNGELIVY